MTAMSTYDSSSSPASSIADAGWQTPSKNERETTEGNDNPISEEENTKQDTIPESGKLDKIVIGQSWLGLNLNLNLPITEVQS
jgi:hypothetical protein